MRRTRWIILLAPVVAVGAVGLARAQPQSGIVRPTAEPSRPSVQLGAQLYAGNCSTCHGIDGSGISKPRRGAGGVLGAGPPLANTGAMAADFYLRTGYMPLSSIHDQPGRDRVLFTETEIRSLVGYIASLGPGPAIPHPQPGRGNIADGLHEFTLHCAGCHQIVARGGFVTGARVPPLQSATATQIAQAVRLGPYLMPRFSARQISDAQLNSIVAYVLSTRHPDNRGGWGIGNLGPVPEGIVAWLIGISALIGVCIVIGERLRS